MLTKSGDMKLNTIPTTILTSLFLFVCALIFFVLKLHAEEHNLSEQDEMEEVTTVRLLGHGIGLKFLSLALQHTEDLYGPFHIETFDTKINSTKRKLLEIQSSRLVDVVLLPANKEAASDLHLVAFPLHLGLLGLRVVAVQHQNLENVEACETIEDLRQFSFGHGKDWLDTRILQHNRIPVVLGDSIENLYKMMLKQRFDCFSRGVMEFQVEKRDYRIGGIEPIQTFYLYYPYMDCFYVSPDKKELAERILIGLKRSYADGTYLKGITELYGSDLEHLTGSTTRVIHLDNPFMPEESLQALNMYMLPTLKQLVGKP